MLRNIVSAPADLTLAEFREHFVLRHLHRIYPVTQEGPTGPQLIGIISLYDLDRVPPEKWGETTVGQTMVTNVVTVTADDPILTAIARMNEKDLEFLPVIDNQHSRRLVGGITRTDVFSGEWANLL
jgi:CIC family chloride channel protein